MFVNCSNHRLVTWSDNQKKAAMELDGNAKIVDYPFPNVCANADEEEIGHLALLTVKEILEFEPDVVMCQGEFTLTFHIVQLLKEKNVKVVAACSERKATVQQLDDGSTQKISKFYFVRFREY